MEELFFLEFLGRVYDIMKAMTLLQLIAAGGIMFYGHKIHKVVKEWRDMSEYEHWKNKHRKD